MTSMPTIRQLEYLVALAEERNFQRAAAKCNVSQPGLSAQIRQIEETLGLRLFERDRRRVWVTPEGHLILEQARIVLGQMRVLVGIAEDHNEEIWSGSLKLGVIPTIAPYLLPQVLPTIRREHPELKLYLHEGQTHLLVRELERGNLDLLLVALEADLGRAETYPLFKDEFLLAMPSKHPLAKKTSVHDSDLVSIPMLLLDDGHCLRTQALPICQRADAQEVGDFRASSLPTLVQMVANQIGLTLLPKLALRLETTRSKTVTTRPFKGPTPFRTVGLAWRPSSPKKKQFVELAQLLQLQPQD